MPSTSTIEEKSVQFSELKAGLQLRAGHSVLIIVGDGKGNPRYRKLAQHWDEDGSGGDAEPSDPPGTQGGVPDGKFEIHMQLHAASGAPLAHERVRICDPDTGEQVGKAAVTDDDGVLKARVPDEKDYLIHIDAKEADDHPDAFGDMTHPVAAHLPDPDSHGLLHVAFVDGSGAPLKGETVKVEGGHELVTDDGGSIQMHVEHGVITVEIRGVSFTAHSVMTGDLEGDDAPYRFMVES